MTIDELKGTFEKFEELELVEKVYESKGGSSPVPVKDEPELIEIRMTQEQAEIALGIVAEAWASLVKAAANVPYVGAYRERCDSRAETLLEIQRCLQEGDPVKHESSCAEISNAEARKLAADLAADLAGNPLPNREAQDDSISKIEPRYLLVLRYWGVVTTQHGDSWNMGQGWVYLNETYQDMPSVLKRLNESMGAGKFNQSEIIGLWALDRSNRIDLSFTDTEHVKPKHVGEEKWITREWSVKK